MKRCVVFLLPILFFAATISGFAQVAHSASGRRAHLFAGGEGSVYQPDYAGEGVAQASPQRLYGIGAYVDATFTRWVGLEAQGRWLHWNEYAGINENSYSIGPRVPVGTFKRFTPYGKFLVGMGSGSFLTGRTTVLTYGGGVDYRLSNRFSIRAVDFEYQTWYVQPHLNPYGGSAGISYRIF
jgi:hypothetical protein